MTTHHESSVNEEQEGEESTRGRAQTGHEVDDDAEEGDSRQGEGDFSVGGRYGERSGSVELEVGLSVEDGSTHHHRRELRERVERVEEHGDEEGSTSSERSGGGLGELVVDGSGDDGDDDGGSVAGDDGEDVLLLELELQDGKE